jgi:hypothetical protein
VLSYGPALVLVKREIIGHPYTPINWFYAPLDWLCQLSPAFSDWLRWYGELWLT